MGKNRITQSSVSHHTVPSLHFVGTVSINLFSSSNLMQPSIPHVCCRSESSYTPRFVQHLWNITGIWASSKARATNSTPQKIRQLGNSNNYPPNIHAGQNAGNFLYPTNGKKQRSIKPQNAKTSSKGKFCFQKITFLSKHASP